MLGTFLVCLRFCRIEFLYVLARSKDFGSPQCRRRTFFIIARDCDPAQLDHMAQVLLTALPDVHTRASTETIAEFVDSLGLRQSSFMPKKKAPFSHFEAPKPSPKPAPKPDPKNSTQTRPQTNRTVPDCSRYRFGDRFGGFFCLCCFCICFAVARVSPAC